MSKYHKKQIMDLGFRHTEAKCLLESIKRVDKFKHFLSKNIDELTIFCMHDTVFAKRFEIISPKKSRFEFMYGETFFMVSHKTKKILTTWLNKYHPYGENIYCKCHLCNIFYNLKKLSECKINNFIMYRTIKLPDSCISRIMYLFSHLRKILNYDEEYIYYLILFKIELFDKHINSIFITEHKNQFYCNILEYINNTRKLKLFNSLVNNNLPQELISHIHDFVLTID